MPKVQITIATGPEGFAQRTLGVEMLVSPSTFNKPVKAIDAGLPEIVIALRGLADHIEATLGSKCSGSAAPLRSYDGNQRQP